MNLKAHKSAFLNLRKFELSWLLQKPRLVSRSSRVLPEPDEMRPVRRFWPMQLSAIGSGALARLVLGAFSFWEMALLLLRLFERP